MPIAENVNGVQCSNFTATNTTMWNPDTESQDVSVTANGKYFAFISDEIATNNNKAINATCQINSFLQNRDEAAGIYGKSKLMFSLERKGDDGSWHPLHGLFETVDAVAYGPGENGGIIPEQEMTFGPNVDNVENRRPIDHSDGENIDHQDHPKNGVLPDFVRLVVIIHEKEFGGSGAFQSVNITVDYELRAE